jgi:hypothetical protein
MNYKRGGGALRLFALTGSLSCVVSGQVPKGNIMDAVLGMDGVRNFRNKTGSWAGSAHFQILPTSRV